MTTRFLSAFFVAAFLLLLSLTASKVNAKTDAQANHCQNKTCRCVFSNRELQHTP